MFFEPTDYTDYAVQARLPDDESTRLAALQGYCVLDTLPQFILVDEHANKAAQLLQAEFLEGHND